MVAEERGRTKTGGKKELIRRRSAWKTFEVLEERDAMWRPHAGAESRDCLSVPTQRNLPHELPATQCREGHVARGVRFSSWIYLHSSLSLAQPWPARQVTTM